MAKIEIEDTSWLDRGLAKMGYGKYEEPDDDFEEMDEAEELETTE